jgi:hypothetical protein
MQAPTLNGFSSTVHLADARELVDGIILFPDWTVANPDATGFGNGSLSLEIVKGKKGDILRIRTDENLLFTADGVVFQGQLIARPLAQVRFANSGPKLAFLFMDGVFWDSASALLQRIELANSQVDASPREIAIEVVDADKDVLKATVNITADMPSTPARQRTPKQAKIPSWRQKK